MEGLYNIMILLLGVFGFPSFSITQPTLVLATDSPNEIVDWS